MTVRAASPSDRAAIRRVHEAAFPTAAEADLVEALEAAGLAEASLVAERTGQVLGHVLVSRASLDGDTPILVLAPVGVLPAAQGRGVGSALCRAAVDACRGTDLPLVSLVGEPGLYERFGFEPARPLGLLPPFEVPDEAWMALRLDAWSPAVGGTVTYPPPWDAVL